LKRSEAINKLQRRLIYLGIDCKPPLYDIGYENRVYIAERMLAEMENLGMLPPTITKIKKGDEIIGIGPFPVKYNKWEEEIDEKQNN